MMRILTSFWIEEACVSMIHERLIRIVHHIRVAVDPWLVVRMRHVATMIERGYLGLANVVWMIGHWHWLAYNCSH